MKTKLAIAISSLAALPILSAPPVVSVQAPAPAIAVQAPAPTITVQAPAPAVTIQVSAPVPAVTVVAAVPDTYVWDGSEYVGVVGSQYFYLGPGDVWMTLDAARLARFHEWERIHSDWRDHAIRNERYRRAHDAHANAIPHDNHSHDHDLDHDHGH